MPPTLWIQNPLAIFADGAEGGIVVQGSTIVELVGRGQMPKTPINQTFDASAHVVLPGLINTHHHFYQTLTRALPQALNKELFDWLKALYPVWSHLKPKDIVLSSRLAFAELLLSGCTTTADHHYVFPSGLEQAIDWQVEAAQDLGIRVVLTRGSMDLSQKDGGLPPDSVVQELDDILSDSERLIGAYHDPTEGAMVQIALAPCSPFSVTKQVMLETAALSEKHNVLMHTHLAETEDENAFCQEAFGCRPLDYLEACGWLHDRTWLAHGIHFNEDEINRLGKAGTAVSSCPHSNMYLASGICRACELEQAGVPVGLGVDGSASNDASNMIQEIRQALLIERLRYGAAQVTVHDAIRWATAGSAACLRRPELGRIAVGAQADLALFCLEGPRFSGAHDPLAALIICGAERADYVMVAGQWRVKQGILDGIDLEALQHQHHQAALELVERSS